MLRSLRLVLLSALLAVSLDVARAQTLFADDAPVQEEVAAPQEAPVASQTPQAVAVPHTGAPEGSSWLTKMLYAIYTPPKRVEFESDGTPVTVTMQYPPEIYLYAFVYFSVGMLLIVGPFAYSAGKPRAYRTASRSRP